MKNCNWELKGLILKRKKNVCCSPGGKGIACVVDIKDHCHFHIFISVRLPVVLFLQKKTEASDYQSIFDTIIYAPFFNLQFFTN